MAKSVRHKNATSGSSAIFVIENSEIAKNIKMTSTANQTDMTIRNVKAKSITQKAYTVVHAVFAGRFSAYGWGGICGLVVIIGVAAYAAMNGASISKLFVR